jgi:hypothetical protein
MKIFIQINEHFLFACQVMFINHKAAWPIQLLETWPIQLLNGNMAYSAALIAAQIVCVLFVSHPAM